MAVIIDIDHETGDLSQYTSSSVDGGDLSVTRAAALAGTGYGLSCLIDDIVSIYGQATLGSPSASGVEEVRFYINPNTLTMSNTNVVYSAYLYNSASTLVARVGMRYADGIGYQCFAVLFDDAGAGQSTTFVAIADAEHCLEIKLLRATNSTSNDGSIELWLDDVSVATVTGKDNYDRFVDFSFIRFGAIVPSAAVSGTYYLDELVVNDDGAYIGPNAAAFQAAWARNSNTIIR